MVLVVVVIIVVVLIAAGFWIPPVREWVATRGSGVTSTRRGRRR